MVCSCTWDGLVLRVFFSAYVCNETQFAPANESMAMARRRHTANDIQTDHCICANGSCLADDASAVCAAIAAAADKKFARLKCVVAETRPDRRVAWGVFMACLPVHTAHPIVPLKTCKTSFFEALVFRKIELKMRILWIFLDALFACRMYVTMLYLLGARACVCLRSSGIARIYVGMARDVESTTTFSARTNFQIWFVSWCSPNYKRDIHKLWFWSSSAMAKIALKRRRRSSSEAHHELKKKKKKLNAINECLCVVTKVCFNFLFNHFLRATSIVSMDIEPTPVTNARNNRNNKQSAAVAAAARAIYFFYNSFGSMGCIGDDGESVNCCCWWRVNARWQQNE